MRLTTHLPTTLSPTTATTHPFLRLSGQGQIPKLLLAQWLSQDRLYAQSYVRFMGHLLSKIRLPLSPHTERGSSTAERTMGILVDALNNIQTELKFFETTAAEYGLGLNTAPPGEEVFGPAPITQAYIDMFMSAGSSACSLLEGMVVLWATEVCYLKAWSFARGFLGEGQGSDGKDDADGGALRERFIQNWSSAEFENFVVRIGEVVDDLAEEVLGGLKDEQEKGEILARCERWWKQVVWLEERFWPDVN